MPIDAHDQSEISITFAGLTVTKSAGEWLDLALGWPNMAVPFRDLMEVVSYSRRTSVSAAADHFGISPRTVFRYRRRVEYARKQGLRVTQE